MENNNNNNNNKHPDLNYQELFFDIVNNKKREKNDIPIEFFTIDETPPKDGKIVNISDYTTTKAPEQNNPDPRYSTFTQKEINDALKEEEIAKAHQRFEEIAKKSTGEEHKTKEKSAKTNNSNIHWGKTFYFKKIIPLTISIAIALGLAVHVKNSIENISLKNVAINAAVEKAEENLAEVGIITLDDKGNAYVNDGLEQDDYNKLGLVDPNAGEAYAYYEAINDAKSNDPAASLWLAKSITSSDGLTKYQDWDHYCADHGYFTVENGKVNEQHPDMLVFENYAEAEIFEAYKNGENVVKDLNTVQKGK